MKKRAKLYLITLSCLSLVLFAALSLFWIGRQAVSTSRQMLEGYLASAVTLAQPPEDAQAFVRQLSQGISGDIRITLLDLDGNVLGDSHASPDSMPNHLDREEISTAAATGRGESLRSSDTTGVSTLYVAQLWNQDHILRVAMPVAAAREFVNSVLPVLLITLLILCILITSVVDRFSKRLAKPYESMLVYLERTLQKGGDSVEPFVCDYEEMQPIVQYFHHLLEQISGHIVEITSKTTEIENIVGAMQEGLLLLDDELNVLLINPQGCRFLGIPRDSWQRKLTWLYRNDQLADALKTAQSDHSRQVLDIDNNTQTFRFYITPVPEGGYVLLISDVTEIARLERMRSDFVANVSHELKTPLTSISGFAELMGTGMVNDPNKMKEYASKIHTESLRLVRLIDDILKLSAVENANAPALEQTVPVDVEGVFAYVLELLSSQISQKKLHTNLSGSLRLYIPQEHLHELALNLCDNAVKYNREGGFLSIRLFENGFSVQDSGIGIAPEDQSRIFERFYRADKARSRKTGGTGLGLSIAKHTVALYGGSISVKSDTQGSTFTVVFPRHLVV